PESTRTLSATRKPVPAVEGVRPGQSALRLFRSSSSLFQSLNPVQHNRDGCRRRVADLSIDKKPAAVTVGNVVRAGKTHIPRHSGLEEFPGNTEGQIRAN